MKKVYAVLNLISSIAIIYWNYYTVVKGVNGNDVGEISDRYDTLFTPAGYAFSIWGIIFLGMLALSVFHIYRAFFAAKDNSFIEQTGPWFILANIFNGLWVWFWLTEKTEFTPILMIGILISLLTIIVRSNMNRTKADFGIKLFHRIPIAIYAGWISVALIANIGAVLVKSKWGGEPLSPVIWTYILISIATAVNFIMIHQRKLIAFGLVGVWALSAIAVKQWEPQSNLAWFALACAVFISVIAIATLFNNKKSLG